ncbi:hypothetical protein IWX58_003511 [Rubrivivax gelatinosus]|nr:hypothetical protein [Rubrivivax gelatinosus]
MILSRPASAAKPTARLRGEAHHPRANSPSTALPRAPGGRWSEVLGGGPACRAGGHERNRPPGDRGSLRLPNACLPKHPKLTNEARQHVREQQRKSRPPGRAPAFMSPGRAAPALLLILHSGTRPDVRLRDDRGTPLTRHLRWLPRASGGRWSEVLGGGPACRAGEHERNRPPGDRGSLRLPNACLPKHPKLTNEARQHVRAQQRKSRPPGHVPAFMSPGRAAPALLLVLHSATRPDALLVHRNRRTDRSHATARCGHGRGPPLGETFAGEQRRIRGRRAQRAS